ncbi:MAG: FAD-binding oxidoreductase [Actinomycetota bacterium]|nr:FAD-binding oxidoreductase [Actinomycetota bacterium]
MTGTRGFDAVRVNDVHSHLNETSVARVLPVDSLDAIRSAISDARVDGLPISACGARHAMGGQQFCSGGVLLDTTPLTRILGFDREQGTIEVEAGITWPELVAFMHTHQNGTRPAWSIRQKQSGADRLSLGGAVAANAHGRALALRPIVDDVDSLTLVDPDGEVRRCSRSENRELFSLAAGGYGLFGVIYSVTLRLAPRRKLERVVEVRTINGLARAFDERIKDGFLYGDFQFAIDPNDPEFLRRGVFSCYRPVEDATPIAPDQRVLTLEDWKKLLYLAHVDKAQAWERYTTHYLATSGQIYLSDKHQFSEYVEGYHASLDALTRAAHPATEMITEVYVPRDRLDDFMAEAAADFRSNQVDVIYGTIRLIERDDESFLAWARERWACVIFNLHTVHTAAGIEQSRAAFLHLIDMAVARGGSYYLTYHRWARHDQIAACYPRFAEFLAHKRRHDPEERFQSDWYRHHAALFA